MAIGPVLPFLELCQKKGQSKNSGLFLVFDPMSIFYE